MKFTLKSPLKKFRVTQKFGDNALPWYKTDLGLKGHNGLDLEAPDSTEVYAAHDGRVTFTGYDGSGGLGVVIRTTQKFDHYDKGKATYYKTIYWHLKKDTIVVTGGQTVKAGQLIALADNTGRSTGAHLHFGLKPIYKGEQDWEWYNEAQTNGYSGAIDPLPFFEEMPVEKPSDLLVKLNTSPETVEAIKAFQTRHGLFPDGVIGPKTRAKLIT